MSSSIDRFVCPNCGDEIGIVGELTTPDDFASQDYYDEEVRRHRAGECGGGHRGTSPSPEPVSPTDAVLLIEIRDGINRVLELLTAPPNVEVEEDLDATDRPVQMALERTEVALTAIAWGVADPHKIAQLVLPYVHRALRGCP